MAQLKKYTVIDFDDAVMTLFPAPSELLKSLEVISDQLCGMTWRNKKNNLLELHRSDNAWCSKNSADNLTENEKILTSTLNKMTILSYKKLLPNLLNLEIKDKEKVLALVKIIFDKILLEPHFVSLYYNLCFELDKNEKSNWRVKNFNVLAIIRQYCKSLFMNKNIDVFENEEERLKHKRKILGLINLISELFNNNEFALPIFRSYLSVLMDSKNDIGIEYLCKLVTKSGKKLMKIMSENHKNALWNKLRECHRNMELPSRIRFSIQNIFELKDNDWEAKSNKHTYSISRKPQLNVGKGTNYKHKKRIVFNPIGMLVEFICSGDENVLTDNIMEFKGNPYSIEICKAIMTKYFSARITEKDKIQSFAKIAIKKNIISKNIMELTISNSKVLIDDLRMDVPMVDKYVEEIMNWFE